jgi:hypothetical protein
MRGDPMYQHETKSDFSAQVIRLGMVTISAGIVANFTPVLFLWLGYGVVPPWGDLLKIWGVAATVFAAAWIVQPISYFPVLGMSGSYVSWLVGSVADIRLPASTMAQKATGVEHGTPEGEVISTIAIAASVLVSVSMVTLFTFIGAAVVPMLPKVIQKSFDYILPAAIGAIFFEFATKYPKAGLITLVFAAVLAVLAARVNFPPAWLLSLITIAGAIGIARFLYKREIKHN